jgi:acetylglutamate kinase
VDEVIGVLADQAPDLHEALERAKADGLAYVILDGKIFSADRCGEKTTSVKGTQIDLWYSGKAHEHGGNGEGA